MRSRWRGWSAGLTGWWTPAGRRLLWTVNDSCLLIRRNIASVARDDGGVGAADGRIGGGARGRARTRAHERATAPDGRDRIGGSESVGSGGPDAGTGVCRWGRRSSVGPVYGCLPGSAASMPAEPARVTPGGPSRAIAGDGCVGQTHQIRGRQLDLETAPAGRHEDRIELERGGVDDDRERPARAERADPADDVAGRPLRLGRVGHDRAPAADARRPGASGRARDRPGRPPARAVRRRSRRASCGPARGRRRGPPRRPCRRSDGGRGRARGGPAARTRGPVGHPGPGDQVERGRRCQRPRPDATDFGYAPGGSVAVRVHRRAATSRRRAPDRCPRRKPISGATA